MTPIHLEYTLTANDFAEARRRFTLNPGPFIIAFMLVVCSILIPEALRPDVPLLNPPPAKPTVPLFDALFPFIPWIVIMLIIGFPALRMIRRMATPPWKHPRQRQAAPSPLAFWLQLIFALGITVVAAIWAITAKRNLLISHGPAADPYYSPVLDTLLPVTPLFVIALFFPLLIGRISNPARLWSRQYHLHRPSTIDIDETGLRSSEPCASHEYKWSYFRGHNQTPNLFLLYPSSLLFIMIPKRAFPTPEAQQQFADFLARTIVPPTTAFPVLPLPALPLAPPTPIPPKI